jgi:hypothetical protein
MKCFFKRPPETQKALGATLAAGLADTHQVRIFSLVTMGLFISFQ